MKPGDRVQFAFNNIRGAKGVIVSKQKGWLYHSAVGSCPCFLVEYTLSNGTTVLNTTPSNNLILIQGEE